MTSRKTLGRKQATMFFRYTTPLFIMGLLAVNVFAQSEEEIETLRQGLQKLEAQIDGLDKNQRVDAEVCAKGVDWIIRHNEFYRPNYVQSAQKAIELGSERAKQIAEGNADWGTRPGVHALGYRSRVDDSVQPYLVTLPEGFEMKGAKRWPLYVVLHGRNSRLTEAHFISSANGKPAPKGQTWIQLDVFGRTNNAYRWAGETDVFEAIADVSKRYRVDESRVTLWGFSMGGAGAWHLGLHHPSRWASVGAGAGFVDFYRYQKQTEQLPEYQHRALRIYDAKDYALNLSVVPFITYGGEKDAQLAASLHVQEEAEKLGVPLKLIVGPNMGHKFDDASKATFMEFLAEHNSKGRKRVPGLREFEFVTYTLKYNKCEWLTIHEQSVPYEKTTVTSTLDDDGVLNVETDNVSALSILRTAANRVSVDGSESFDLNLAADANLIDVYLVKDAGGWSVLSYEDSLDFEENPNQKKRHNLQGPIDDAFMEPFVCVQGTGQPWSPELQEYSDWSLSRFQTEFDKWMRAHPLVVKDSAVTEKMIRSKNLILFGDPGSNSLIKTVVEELPLKWEKDSITFQGQTYSTRDHAVALVFPNPLNPRKYLVINSGMTTHEKDFKASNSWLFPKFGDHAVIQFSRKKDSQFGEQVIQAGIFDSHWNN
ncbi:prolyl oligopeptidase family serine peptidase [Thalassoglobus polymorphus]|nr:prolyl oligopeptidase family serine peptidase [Thalassoglobus polymorphus]